ncbi:butyrophilin-like protein 10 [Lampris incognitus]|uniref:butyrophilin-like protein 10 n=1 Tax=Lampris incognitus TaxID=2546036 RepID=UPI0024B5A1F7|nr:butyrophilin-like protein 10 [Lampris incognitus]XP_056156690.1 butyrophilin-like protein 10 [Lampris incognitus]
MAFGLFQTRIILKNLCSRIFSNLFFYTSFTLLIQVDLDRGEAQSVVALVGENVILPFKLSTPQDAKSLTVEWSRDDLKPKYVHVYHKSEDQYDLKNPQFKERTALSVERQEHGDVSLKLLNVQLLDQGKYTGYIPSLNEFTDVFLTVGSVASPVTSLRELSSSGVVLGCESKGWYPEPKVLWLDGEGNLLPVRSTKTVQAPDGLYTINSAVTVEETETNRFTCEVQQLNINQTRQTQIHVPVDFFRSQRSCRSHLLPLLSVLVLLLPLLLVMVSHWKRERQKSSISQIKQRGGTHQGISSGQLKPEKEETSSKADETDTPAAVLHPHEAGCY